MTNANLPDRWLSDRRFRRENLSDAAFRAYVNSRIYAVGNRTEGVIEPADIRFIPDFDRAAVPELIENHLWEPLGRDHGWLIADFSTTQTGKDLLASYEKRKAYDRQRQARAKLAKITADQSDSGGISGGTIPVDSYRPDPNRLKQPRRQEISANSKQPNPVDLDGQPLCSVCHKRPALGERATGWRDSTLCNLCNDELAEDIRAGYDEEHA